MSEPHHRYDVFISYAHEDEASAAELERVLTRTWVPFRRRLTVYRDRNRMRAGVLWEEIEEALSASRYLIVCCSSAAGDSEWVNREIEAFVERNGARGEDGQPRVLRCRVGIDESDEDPIPAKLMGLSREGDGELYIPDLRGDPRRFTRREREHFRHEAFALLAVAAGLPDRDAVYGRMQKARLVLAAAILVALIAAGTGFAYTRSDVYQIRRVIAAVRPELGWYWSAEWMKALGAVGEADRALEGARSIASAVDRSVAMAAVAEVLTAMGRRDEAGAVARELLAETKLDPSVHGITEQVVESLARGGLWQESVELTLRMEFSSDRSEALRKVVNIMTKRGAPKQVLERALELGLRAATEEETLLVRLSEQTEWVEALAEAGRMEEAGRMAGNVRNEAASLDEDRHAVLTKLAETLARIGRTEEAALIGRRLGAAGRLDVAMCLAEGDARRKGSADRAAQAFEVAIGKDDFPGDQMYLRMALAFAREDRAEEAASWLFRRSAWFAVRRIAEAAKELLEAGADAKAVRFAKAVAARMREPDEKEDTDDVAVAWAAIAELLSAGGDSQGARNAAAAGLRLARQTDYLEGRAKLLCRLGPVVAKQEGEKAGLRLVEEGLKTGERMTDDGDRDDVMVAVSEAYSAMGKFREARLAGERCEGPQQRAEAYVTLVQRWAARRRPEVVSAMERMGWKPVIE